MGGQRPARDVALRRGTAALLAALLLALPALAAADVDLWPLLEISDESTTILYPLWVREQQRAQITRADASGIELRLGAEEDDVETIPPGGSFAGHSFDELLARGVGPVETPDFIMAFPWYYRTDYGRDQHVLWPIYKRSRGRTERVAPLWFAGENSYTLLPIIHRTPTYTLWLTPPVYVERDGPTWAVFPLFLRTEYEFYSLPAYYRRRKPGEPAVDMLFPLYGWQRDAHQQTLWAVAGLYGRIRGPDDATEDWVFPLWYHGHDAKSERTGILFPLYFGIREPQRSATWLLPVWIDRTPTLSRTWVVPFWLEEHEVQAGGAETRSWLSLLWPIYAREEVRAADGTLLERYRRFGIF